jgi:hypothetical protein
LVRKKTMVFDLPPALYTHPANGRYTPTTMFLEEGLAHIRGITSTSLLK